MPLVWGQLMRGTAHFWQEQGGEALTATLDSFLPHVGVCMWQFRARAKPVMGSSKFQSAIVNQT